MKEQRALTLVLRHSSLRSAMPVRIGFSEYRRQMLEKELARIIDLMPQLGIQKVILTGSYARGETGPDSNLNLVIVQETARGYQFGRREDFFSYHLNPEVAMDYVVYTPEEFDQESESNPSLRYALERGRVVYEG